MKLYEITHELSEAIEKYEEAATNEALLQLEQTINSLTTPFTQKALGVGYYLKNLEADAVAIKSERERLSMLAEVNKAKFEWLKGYLKRNMEQVQTLKVSSPTLTLAIQKSPPSVVIDDETKVNDKYKRVIPEHKEVDKKAILEEWKTSGLGVDGAHIVDTNTHLRIK